MSQENVANLRSLTDAIGNRDFDRVIERTTEDVEVRPAVEGIDVDPLYRGRGELRGFCEQITEAWEELTVEVTETVEAPGDRVLAVERWHVRGRDELVLEFELIDVYTFRDGLIARIDGFLDKAAALEAVGLSE